LGTIILYIIGLPYYNKLRKLRLSPALASVIVILTIFLAFILPISLIASALISKLSGILENPDYLLKQYETIKDYFQEQFGFEILSNQNIEKAKEFASGMVGGLLSGTFGILADLVMTAFFLFYLLKSDQYIEQKIKKYAPLNRRTLLLLKKELTAQVYSNVIGSPLLALLQSIAAILGFWIFNVNDFIFWGFMCGIFSFIPFVGSALIWVPAAVLLLASGNTGYGIMLLAYGALVITNIDNVFRFILQKKFADVHPIITVLGVIFGVNFFGITGLIFGPLLISIFIILLKLFLEENFSKDTKVLPSRSEIK
jgi:predicted PurR-regulated permease PerM